jgi:hypothetical protein
MGAEVFCPYVYGLVSGCGDETERADAERSDLGERDGGLKGERVSWMVVGFMMSMVLGCWDVHLPRA